MEAPILNCFRRMKNSQLSWLTKNSASAEVSACAKMSEGAKKELALLPDPKGRSIQIVYGGLSKLWSLFGSPKLGPVL